ncbi:PepSY domain-containing protein [Thiofilum flexile]|uniref:PepSY domain-containing protein n=1 Tax=Thiofilum flexile TaxID=125627 RepID=UPI00036DBF35|nr:PepSY domain-containing protein [Thiofilum flexile]
MKRVNKLILTGFVASTLMSGAAFADNDSAAAASAAISLNDAVAKALQATPGTAVGVDFSTEKGQNVWEVEIIAADQTSHEVQIDAANGSVVKNAVDNEQDDEDEGDKDDDGDKK